MKESDPQGGGDGEKLSRREAAKVLVKYGTIIAGATTVVLSSRQVLAGPDSSADNCLRKNPPPYCP